MTKAEFMIRLWNLFYLVWAAAEDVRKREINVKTLLFFITVNLAAVIGCDIEPLNRLRLIGCIPGILLLVISRISHGAIGVGDAVVILWVGYAVGILDCLQLLNIAWAICFAAAGIRFIFRKKSAIPFIPFLCIGYFISLYVKLAQ